MTKTMEAVAIIPARGGSKRIPKKNIRLFCGKPIIGYSIDTAHGAGIFSDIMVSTDDAEIAEIAERNGASVPFMRSRQTADDFSPLSEVIKEVIEKFENLNKRFDFICCILPTAPLIDSSDVSKGLQLLLDAGADSLVPVVKYSHPVQRALNIKNERIRFCWPENQLTRTNDLEPLYHDTGSFYWLRASSFKIQHKIFMEHSIALELPEERVQDIDNEADWRLAEFKYKFFKTAV
jgi:pseudaminic acid cytidylyltransferase